MSISFDQFYEFDKNFKVLLEIDYVIKFLYKFSKMSDVFLINNIISILQVYQNVSFYNFKLL